MNPEVQQQPGGSYINPEAQIDNIIEQIDPRNILDNLDHALKGEFFDKERNKWIKNPSNEELVNDACRGAIISFLTPILVNNTTMANISNEREFSSLMHTIIESITRLFVVNLEKFGFVPKGKGNKELRFENKGTPDSARMTNVTNMIYMVCFLTFSRARNGMESRKLFGSLSMTDSMSFNSNQDQPKKGFFNKLMGRG